MRQAEVENFTLLDVILRFAGLSVIYPRASHSVIFLALYVFIIIIIIA